MRFAVMTIVACSTLPMMSAEVFAQRLYWTNGFGSAVHSADLDGQNPGVLLYNDTQVSRDAAVDPVDNRLYWIQFDGFESQVRSCNLDGSALHIVVVDDTANLNGLAIDHQARTMYYTRTSYAFPYPLSIRRVDLDGGNPLDIVEFTSETPAAVALDLTAQKLYWATVAGTVYRANLDGSAIETILPLGLAVHGLALDPAAGLMFWTQSSDLWRATLDGTDATAIVTDLGLPEHVAADPLNARVYWADQFGAIGRSNYDGSVVQADLITPAGSPFGIEVDPRICSGHGSLDGDSCVCTDGYTGGACECGPDPCENACSGNGSCACGFCACSEGWTGSDCSVEIPQCLNNCSGHGLCDDGVCACFDGWQGQDCSIASPFTARLFMARDGEELDAAPSGNTTAYITPGSKVRVMAWIEDNVQGQNFNGYQGIVIWDAVPQPGAQGSVTYLDEPAAYRCSFSSPDAGQPCDPDDPEACGDPELCVQLSGNSARVDTTHPDWVLAGEVSTPPITPEVPGVIFGMAATLANPAQGIQVQGLRYLGEFDLQASPDAAGEFELAWNVIPGSAPPLTAVFRPFGDEFIIDEFQNLTLLVTECGDGEVEGDEECDFGDTASGDGCDEACMIEGAFGGPCAVAAQCADVSPLDGIRDDPCVWWACEATACVGTDVMFADIGGEFGARPDGTADASDRFHALNCFSNQDTLGNPGAYPCEPSPPDATNVDAGGQFGSCVPDGVCDANDAFHAINAFEGASTCLCPLDGAPQPGIEPPSAVVQRSSLAVSHDGRRVRPGETFEVTVHLRGGLQGLRGYQLHLGIAGGSRGTMEVIDVFVDPRRDWGFAEASPWMAFNAATAQMAVGLDGAGVAVGDGAYLATFVCRASADADGSFIVDVLSGDGGRSFLFPTAPQRRIDIDHSKPALIEVGARSLRIGRR